MPDLSKVTGILPDLADYLVYGAIAVVTLIGLFKCLIPLWRTTSALRRAITRLQKNAGMIFTALTGTGNGRSCSRR